MTKFEVLDRIVASYDPAMGGSGSKDFKSKFKKAKKDKKKKQAPSKAGVTDHAIVRYFERVMGLNVETVRKGLSKYCKKEDGSYFLDSGLVAVVKDGRVVTIEKKLTTKPY